MANVMIDLAVNEDNPELLRIASETPMPGFIQLFFIRDLISFIRQKLWGEKRK